MKKPCIGCEWCKHLEDSLFRDIWICLDADNSAYMEETGPCGYCGEGEDDV